MQTAVQNQKEIIRQAFDALNSRDRDRFRESHAEDVLLHEYNEEMRGIDAIVEHEWSNFEAFPDMEYAIEDIFAEGNRVAVRHTATGTHQGEFQGIEPAGAEVEIPVMMMFRFEDGKVAEVWLYPDRLGMLQQLGAVKSLGA